MERSKQGFNHRLTALPRSYTQLLRKRVDVTDYTIFQGALCLANAACAISKKADSGTLLCKWLAKHFNVIDAVLDICGAGRHKTVLAVKRFEMGLCANANRLRAPLGLYRLHRLVHQPVAQSIATRAAARHDAANAGLRVCDP